MNTIIDKLKDDVLFTGSLSLKLYNVLRPERTVHDLDIYLPNKIFKKIISKKIDRISKHPEQDILDDLFRPDNSNHQVEFINYFESKLGNDYKVIACASYGIEYDPAVKLNSFMIRSKNSENSDIKMDVFFNSKNPDTEKNYTIINNLKVLDPSISIQAKRKIIKYIMETYYEDKTVESVIQCFINKNNRKDPLSASIYKHQKDIEYYNLKNIWR